MQKMRWSRGVRASSAEMLGVKGAIETARATRARGTEKWRQEKHRLSAALPGSAAGCFSPVLSRAFHSVFSSSVS